MSSRIPNNNNHFFRLTSYFPWMLIPAILMCKEFIPNFRQIIFEASTESVKWPIWMLYAHAYLYQISFFGGIFMLLFNDEIDDKAFRLWSYLLEKLGFQINVKINQRKKQNGAAITELNQMQSEQFQQFLQEQKKYENECKGVIKQF